MSVKERNKPLLERIIDLKSEHPFWGYRRIWAYLKYREGLPINKKRIYRIMQEQKLLVTKNMRLRACRTPMKAKIKADLALQEHYRLQSQNVRKFQSLTRSCCWCD